MRSIWLSKSEYAKIISEINTNYTLYRNKSVAAHYSYGADHVAYVYFFENHGFDDYVIFARMEITERREEDE